MINSAATTLRRLEARLREQVCDVVNLRLALDVQMNRISNMYDDREVPPQDRSRRRVHARMECTLQDIYEEESEKVQDDRRSFPGC